jgi:sugar lactone lactonase YvrE
MPAGISVDAQGQLVVAAALSLRNYDLRNGRELNVVHAAIGDSQTVATPLTVSRYGDQLLVSSWFANTVQIWDPISQSLKASYQDFLVPLNAIAIGDDIIVAELAGRRVVRRKPGAIGSEVLMDNIPVPTGLAYRKGQLYVADWLTGNVYQLLADDQLLQTPLPITTGLKQPEGIALDKQGRLLVLETGTQKLLRINPHNPHIEVLASELAIGLPAVPGYPPSWLLSSVVVDDCGGIIITQDEDNSLLRVGRGLSEAVWRSHEIPGTQVCQDRPHN